MTQFEIKPAADRDQRRILRAVLASSGQTLAQNEEQVTAFLEYARCMSLDARRNWWCYHGNRIACAAACIESPGRTATLFLSSLHDGNWNPRAVLELAGFLSREEEMRGMVLLQCLLDPRDSRNADALLEAGFFEVAELLYMEWSAERATHPPAIRVPARAESLRLGSFDPGQHRGLAELIEATYVDTSDCRRLTGLRSIDDVIEGHKSVGYFDPRRWLLAYDVDRPVGCLLMAENPIRPMLDVAYTGVCPEYRRRGIGRWLLSAGLFQANREGRAGVTLAVDSTNAHAVKLYEQSGFVKTSKRRALVRALRSTPVRA